MSSPEVWAYVLGGIVSAALLIINIKIALAQSQMRLEFWKELSKKADEMKEHQNKLHHENTGKFDGMKDDLRQLKTRTTLMWLHFKKVQGITDDPTET